VFDSGLGGLTVLGVLLKRFPEENFVYLADVARLPYGTKSAEVVTGYAERCFEALLERDVKAVVIACNTATASALPFLAAKSRVPVFGVIEPGVRAALDAWKDGRLLVLATAATIASGAYEQRLRSARPDGRLELRACPLLVPLAEEGWWDHPVADQVIRHYVGTREGLDAILLGCTHYPLLVPSFRRVLGEDVALVHGAGPLAVELEARLDASGLRRRGERAPRTVTLLSTDRVAPGLPLLEGFPDDVRHFLRIDL
jgi:glutamate racemase